jgi:hypothetical protein
MNVDLHPLGIFHTRLYAKATISGRIVQGVDASKRGNKIPTYVVFKQEKELTGPVHSFLVTIQSLPKHP